MKISKDMKLDCLQILLFIIGLYIAVSICKSRENWWFGSQKDDGADDLATFGAMIQEVQAQEEASKTLENGAYDLTFNGKSCKRRDDAVAVCTDTAPVYQTKLERMNPNENLYKLQVGDKYCHADGRGFLYCTDNADDSERFEIQKDSNDKYYMKLSNSKNHPGTLNGKYCGHVNGSDYHGIRCNFDSPPNATPMGQDGWTRDFYSDINLVSY